MGEARRRALAVRQGAGQGPDEPQVVDTLGGRMHVRWDEGAAATPNGQLVFFAEFLAATALAYPFVLGAGAWLWIMGPLWQASGLGA